MTLLATSMPWRRPRSNTAAHVRITVAVQASWSRNDRGENPSSGGRMADASTPGAMTEATSDTAKYNTQPTTTV
jgi:hypothetical protein